jgi:thiamine-monophosphate kinase
MSRTEISAIGEFGLIERIRSLVDLHPDDSSLRENLLMGISDDAAVYRPTPGKLQLLTTDAFAEGIHFDLTYTSLKHLGWKVMAANFSDLAAMGAVPRYATVTLSLPEKISVEMVEDFYAGAARACTTYGCLIAGGDTITSPANALVSVSVVGEADPSQIRYRNGAKPGDLICVTGHLGGSLAGLKVLQREKQRFKQSGNFETFRPQLEPYARAIEKHLMPKPRLDISTMMSGQVTINSLIDVSDGLSSEVHHLCNASNAGASVYEHNLPVEQVTQAIAGEFGESPTDYALYGGEEYELLFTLSDAEYKILEPLTGDVTIIGRMQEKSRGVQLVRENGEEVALPFGGWEHFKR